MSKKHFIALADVIRNSPNAFSGEAILLLADFCKAQNSDFNRDRWLGYIAGRCGPSGGAPKAGVRWVSIQPMPQGGAS